MDSSNKECSEYCTNDTINKYELPVNILQEKTVNTLSTLLNPLKVIPTDEGIPRDWRGLADLIGCSSEQVSSLLSHNNPTSYLLQLWYKKNNSTIIKLQLYLQQLDRWDAYDDTEKLIDEDIENYVQFKKKCKTSSTTTKSEIDDSILTIDDVRQLTIYDAFLLFADDDIRFATEVIEKMESKQYGYKICVKERDLIGGLTFEHEAIMKLISERCNRLIVIISPAFLKSPMLKFFLNFAQALGIEQKQRKVIPCIYERCKLPCELSYYYMLDYNRSSPLWNFWDKLSNSIKTPNISTYASKENTAIQEKKELATSPSNHKFTHSSSEEKKIAVEEPLKNIPKHLNSVPKVTFNESTSTSVSERKPMKHKKPKSIKSWFRKKVLNNKDNLRSQTPLNS